MSFSLPACFEKLGLMAWPLTLCLIVAIAVILERLVFFAKAAIKQNADYEKLAQYLSENKNQAKNIRDELISISLSEIQGYYYRGLKTLRIIGSIAPMIGLLGTILGIISAFKVIAGSTSAVAPNMIADGLWQAMLTTAFGLFIALPALLVAHFFKYLGDKKLGNLCLKLNKLSISFELK